MNSLRMFAVMVLVLLLQACDNGGLTDSNISMPSRNWNYANKVRAVVEVRDAAKPVNIYFKLRHTSDYRYSNIFVLLHVSGGTLKKQSRRYELRLAQPDGQWLGAGSGNLFTSVVPLLTNYKFPAPGKYLLEVEQNMRDNPLREISDVGIRASLAGAGQ